MCNPIKRTKSVFAYDRPKAGYLESLRRRTSSRQKRRSSLRRTSKCPHLPLAGSLAKVAKRWGFTKRLSRQQSRRVKASGIDWITTIFRFSRMCFLSDRMWLIGHLGHWEKCHTWRWVCMCLREQLMVSALLFTGEWIAEPHQRRGHCASGPNTRREWRGLCQNQWAFFC